MTTILSISSHVARGHVGNAVARIAWHRLGHEVWEVPTVVWSTHPGLGAPKGLVLEARVLSEMLEPLCTPPAASGIGMIATGYFATAAQVEAAAVHVRALRSLPNPPLYCCDPITGDNGRLYVGRDVLEALSRHLLPLADIVTPNVTELEHLTASAVVDRASCIAAARRLGVPICVVTSAPTQPGRIANLLVRAGSVHMADGPRHAHAPNGTGDLLTALVSGWIAAGCGPRTALARALSGLDAVLEATLAAGRDVLDPIAVQDQLGRPDRAAPITCIEGEDVE